MKTYAYPSSITSVCGDLMVTPKEVDLIINDISLVVANGLNIALHPGIGFDDVNRYIN